VWSGSGIPGCKYVLTKALSTSGAWSFLNYWNYWEFICRLERGELASTLWGGWGKNSICNMGNGDCRNDITPDNTINRGNDTRDTVDNYVNSVDYYAKEDKK
jgi:hypothetical protein